MENTPNDMVENSPQVQNPSRRRLLKFLAAGGAVTAVSLLPGKWSSPSVKTGVLPAHAQVTPTPTATPDTYEVSCSVSWRTGEGEEGEVFFFSATATNVTANSPAAGVELIAVLSADGQEYPQTKTTNSQGVADFEIIVPWQVDTTGAMATVSFVDKGLYGDDFCTNLFLPN